ncbi:MAG: hypothetical protein LBH19_12315 [Dysgonamonadaceae bacterium]|jgi:hypothetical protein|nr:hypothetical protein [Dysgonamonadaceae bacterium]
MKTNLWIVALFAIVFTCVPVQAQEELPYRSLKTFKQDTIRYLDYNFTLRSDQYIDKTVEYLFHDLELPVIYVSNWAATILQADVVAINLVIRLVGNGDSDRDNSKDYYIRIVFKNAVDGRSFTEALDRDQRNKERRDVFYWTPQLYEVLKDVELKGLESNHHLFKDRHRLIEMNTVESWKELKKIKEAEKAKWRKRIKEEKQTLSK